MRVFLIYWLEMKKSLFTFVYKCKFYIFVLLLTKYQNYEGLHYTNKNTIRRGNAYTL
jgi:hypothetical protein